MSHEAVTMTRWDKLIVRDFTIRVDKTRRAHALVENAVTQRLLDLEEDAKQQAAYSSEDGHPHRELEYEHWAIQEEVPQVLRTSLFVQAYSLFERCMGLIAAASGERLGVRLSVRDLSGKGLQQSMTYLKKACGIQVPDQTLEWNTIKTLQRIRNVLVHKRGTLGPDDQDLRQFAVKHREFMIIESGEIRLHEGFVPFAINEMENFAVLLQSLLD
jgi:hypothetical protein